MGFLHSNKIETPNDGLRKAALQVSNLKTAPRAEFISPKFTSASLRIGTARSRNSFRTTKIGKKSR